MKYVKRYNKFNLQTNCRICLTQSVAKKLPLNAPLRGDDCPEPLIYEALELLSNEKVPRTEKYPNTICIMCVQLLKIAYDLMAQYQESKKKLYAQLKELGEDITEPEGEKVDSVESARAPVEIVVGEETFNIRDLVIVEEDDENEKEIFDGFLKNLGKSVSATFIKKGHKQFKPCVEEYPSLVIEKVVQAPEVNIQREPPIIEMSIEDITSIDEQTDDNVLDNSDQDDGFMDQPTNVDVFQKLEDLTKEDKELVESALNLKYKCPYCHKPMSSLTRAKMHSRSCAKNNADVVCWVCSKTFQLRKHLLKHIKQVHLDKEENTSLEQTPSKRRCQICNKTFKSSGSLFYHMSKHLGKRYSCNHCDKQFYTKTQVNNHAQTHNREKTVVICPICGKGFHYQSGLFYHMKMHTNDRHLQCSYCPKRFYTRNSLKRHELTHTGARPYSCQYCEKKFRSLGEVKKHELLHTGQRPYQCKYCDMGFTQTHNLKMHLMTHTGNFCCDQCGKGFADNDILRFHLKNKHQIDRTDGTNVDEAQDEEEEAEVLLNAEEVQLEDAFYITEDQYENGESEESSSESSNLIVKTFELKDDVWSTLENLD